MQASLASSEDFEIVTRSTAVGGPSWRPLHVHDDFELSYIEAGRLDFRTSIGEFEAEAGDAILMLPEVGNQPRLAGRLTQLHLSRCQLQAASDALSVKVPERVQRFSPGATTARLMALLATCARELPAGDLQLTSLVDAITLSLLPRNPGRAQEPRDARIRTAIDFIHGKLREAVSVDDMARAAGLTRFVFLRQFKAQTGTTPYRYLLERRLDSARELLLQSESSVLSVALEFEFRDPGRFSRAFRHRFGYAPGELLKR
ncbi:MAG: helix-turn-helix transcriptional regulator [Myxococcales bacterium]|nr:helix-turn-helix transcriptional regulator [Myxococcales bacterium]